MFQSIAWLAVESLLSELVEGIRICVHCSCSREQPWVAHTHAKVVFLHSKMHTETNSDLIIKTTQHFIWPNGLQKQVKKLFQVLHDSKSYSPSYLWVLLKASQFSYSECCFAVEKAINDLCNLTSKYIYQSKIIFFCNYLALRIFIFSIFLVGLSTVLYVCVFVPWL